MSDVDFKKLFAKQPEKFQFNPLDDLNDPFSADMFGEIVLQASIKEDNLALKFVFSHARERWKIQDDKIRNGIRHLQKFGLIELRQNGRNAREKLVVFNEPKLATILKEDLKLRKSLGDGVYMIIRQLGFNV